MDFNEYQKLAMVTKKPYKDPREQLVNGSLGLAGESGEVCDMIKKHFSVGNEIDRPAIKKELGDVMWYIAELCDAFDFDLNDVAQTNIDKLRARHGTSFSGSGNRSGMGK